MTGLVSKDEVIKQKLSEISLQKGGFQIANHL